MNRLNLIAEICAKRGMGPKILGILSPSNDDRREEIALNVSRDDAAAHKGDDLRDDDLPFLASSLSFDAFNHKGDEDGILTARERIQLKREMLTRRS